MFFMMILKWCVCVCVRVACARARAAAANYNEKKYCCLLYDRLMRGRLRGFFSFFSRLASLLFILTCYVKASQSRFVAEEAWRWMPLPLRMFIRKWMLWHATHNSLFDLIGSKWGTRKNSVCCRFFCFSIHNFIILFSKRRLNIQFFVGFFFVVVLLIHFCCFWVCVRFSYKFPLPDTTRNYTIYFLLNSR